MGAGKARQCRKREQMDNRGNNSVTTGKENNVTALGRYRVVAASATAPEQPLMSMPEFWGSRGRGKSNEIATHKKVL